MSALPWMLFVLLVLREVVHVVQQFLHHRELRDLYSRLMAKDLAEYERTGQKPALPGLDVYRAARERHKPVGE